MEENGALTIFTPTYNRGRLLPRLFESLQNQTCKNFKWLIIDDGSTDNTKGCVEQFAKQKLEFEIEYKYKENGGKHTAINTMLDMVSSELVCIVDSDDFLSDDAVGIILKDYKLIADKKDVCGMLYLRAHFDGRVIGIQFEDDMKIIEPIEYLINNKAKYGDACDVYKTKILKKFRFPEYKEERFVGETAVWIPMYMDYKLMVVNKAICYCEYLEDGLSFSGRAFRIKNPKGGMANSKVYINDRICFKVQFKNTLLYIAYGFFASRTTKEMFADFPNKKLFLLGIIPGRALHLYWKIKVK